MTLNNFLWYLTFQFKLIKYILLFDSNFFEILFKSTKKLIFTLGLLYDLICFISYQVIISKYIAILMSVCFQYSRIIHFTTITIDTLWNFTFNKKWITYFEFILLFTIFLFIFFWRLQLILIINNKYLINYLSTLSFIRATF